jgi:hypothetical protein
MQVRLWNYAMTPAEVRRSMGQAPVTGTPVSIASLASADTGLWWQGGSKVWCCGCPCILATRRSSITGPCG